jgi:hypothetical protein
MNQVRSVSRARNGTNARSCENKNLSLVCDVISSQTLGVKRIVDVECAYGTSADSELTTLDIVHSYTTSHPTCPMSTIHHDLA